MEWEMLAGPLSLLPPHLLHHHHHHYQQVALVEEEPGWQHVGASAPLHRAGQALAQPGQLAQLERPAVVRQVTFRRSQMAPLARWMTTAYRVQAQAKMKVI